MARRRGLSPKLVRKWTRQTFVVGFPSLLALLFVTWLEVPVQTNPGGHEIVAYVGLAPPVPVDAPRERPTPPPDPAPAPVPTLAAATPVATDPRFAG